MLGQPNSSPSRGFRAMNPGCPLFPVINGSSSSLRGSAYSAPLRYLFILLDFQLSTHGRQPQSLLPLDPASNHWYIACHTEGLTSSKSASPSRPGGLTMSSQTFSVSLSITKRKRANHVQETDGRSCDCDSGLYGSHIASRARSDPNGKRKNAAVPRENETRRSRCHSRTLRSAVEFQSRAGSLVHRAVHGAHRRRRRLHSRLDR